MISAGRLPLLAHLNFSPEQKAAFKDGTLLEAWASAYPFLFDELDVSNARNQAQYGNHFVEWLTAVLLWHTHGLVSLQSKYFYPKHEAKRACVEGLIGGAAMQAVTSLPNTEYFKSPDLFVFSPATREWKFVEVKGPSDNLRADQADFFAKLIELTGGVVELVTLSEAPTPQA